MNAKKILAVLSFVLIAIFLMGCNQEDQVLTPEDLSLQKVLLTPEEIDGVIQMIWSEKLARDVYTTLSGRLWRSRNFRLSQSANSNIWTS